MPEDIEQLNKDIKKLKKILKQNGFSQKLISAIETRALRSDRRQTGVFQSNRHSRWTLIHDHPDHGTDPQYGTEVDCKTILLILLLCTLEFRNAPAIDDPLIANNRDSAYLLVLRGLPHGSALSLLPNNFSSFLLN